MKFPLLVFLFALLNVDALASDRAPQFISIGTGGMAGVYYPAGAAICRLLNEDSDLHGLRCSVEATSGSIYNLDTLRRGDIEFGIAQSDWQGLAFAGLGRFTENGPFEDLRSVFSLQAEPLTILMRRESGIHQPGDLVGQLIDAGAPESTERRLLEDLLAMRDVDIDAVVFSSSVEQGARAQSLCAGDIDVLVLAVEHPSVVVTEASNTCEVDILSIESDVIERQVASTAYYRAATIPGGVYRGLESDIETFGVGAVVVTSSLIDEEIVYLLARSVFRNIDEFRRLHPSFGTLKVESMIKDGMAAPLHRGAERFYRESGWL